MIKVNEKGYIYDSENIWLPPINTKQFEVFNDYHRYLLVDGPRKSSKTYGICHKILRHSFDVDGAMFGIINKTLKNAKSSGVWSLLTNWMLPFWERGMGEKWKPWMPEAWKTGCYGFRVVEGPKMSADTKLSFVRIRNRHGSISEIQCHSLEHSQEVEAKFKGPAFSGFWASEGDQFLDEHAFHILCDALRMWGVPYDQHQIILDMNPPDTGENNWFHDVFFKFKNHPPTDDPNFDPIYHAGLHRIGFSIDDNPQLDPNEKRELIARYRKRKGLYERFILGNWHQDLVSGHFNDVWDDTTHIIGTVDCAEADWEMAVPTPGCTELITGWDMGESKNHSFHILEKIVKEDPITRRKFVSFSVLDEFVVIRTYISIREFVEVCQEKIEHWNNWQKKKFNIDLKWRHWSDTSAFQDRSSADKSDAAITYEASDGQIILNAAPKYKDSNRDKVKLVWQLLYEKRLHVSAQLQRTRAMFANLRSDPNSAAHFVKRDDHKHPFDSLAYPIIAEAPSDMVRSAEIGTTSKKEFSGLVVAGF